MQCGSLTGRPHYPGQPVSKDNPPVPFHLYSMQQAIEDDFILVVLRNYTSYDVAFRIGSKFAGVMMNTWTKRAPARLGQVAVAKLPFKLISSSLDWRANPIHKIVPISVSG